MENGPVGLSDFRFACGDEVPGGDKCLCAGVKRGNYKRSFRDCMVRQASLESVWTFGCGALLSHDFARSLPWEAVSYITNIR